MMEVIRNLLALAAIVLLTYLILMGVLIYG